MTHPDLVALGPSFASVDVQDSETLTQLQRSAIHEAGHHVARAAIGNPGGALELEGPGGPMSHSAVEGQRTTDIEGQAVMSLSGPVAEAEFMRRVMDEGPDFFVAWGAVQDIESIDLVAYPWISLNNMEAFALALMRRHWKAVLRLARALLEAPDRYLSAAEAAAVIGPRVAGRPPTELQRARAFRRLARGIEDDSCLGEFALTGLDGGIAARLALPMELRGFGFYGEMVDPTDPSTVPWELRVAVHETAHQVARIADHLPVADLTIDGSAATPHLPAAGVVMGDPGTYARLLLVGAVAESNLMTAITEHDTTWAASRQTVADVDAARQVAVAHPRLSLPDVELDALVFVRTHWGVILELANRLVNERHQHLDAEQVSQIVGSAVTDDAGNERAEKLRRRAAIDLRTGKVDSILNLGQAALLGDAAKEGPVR